MADDEIIFLGTGGARVVIATQLRATGGLLFYLSGRLILVDPGPGSLIRFLQYAKPYRINKLDVLILTHRHIDHTSDVNVIIDALTEGGKKRKGILFAPKDAVEDDPVVLKYHQRALKEMIKIKAGLEYRIDALSIRFPIEHLHGVETYGVVFATPNYSIGYITDTKYFPELASTYRNDILIINVLRPEPMDYPHLYLPDAEKVIKKTKPSLAVITHFGMVMLRKNPFRIAKELSEKTKVRVIAAKDGMRIRPSDYLDG
ncbi:MBL fold metallo-hydrolase [candidate division WOR-3 bacterium]|uniref:MBL fold metallo-hydrolase n=1 Tax=candidate division WOR-3 bacterium TaxID=2052148 RepID=A0A660SGY2_UNCW3|nr:MAG: MBL fold metallo-hydrolase [candidate division WOR-3 bacterium]